MNCQYKGKSGYKLGEKGYCFTYNKNPKSKQTAYNLVWELKIKKNEQNRTA